MASALERFGRVAARRPWIVIGNWVAIVPSTAQLLRS